MKSKRKFLSIFAILFALVFALSVCFFAACGKKDDEKDDDTTTEQDENTGSTGGDEGGEGSGSGSGETATVTGVTVTPTTLDLVIGETDTGTLTASVTMSDASSYSGAYAWTSSDTTVATVSDSTTATATVTAVAVGTAEITVAVGGQSATCTVTVSEPEPIVTTVTTAEELTTALSQGGAIELGDDITGMFTVETGENVTLDLAGYSIIDLGEDDTNENDTQYTITVEDDAVLTVKDSGDIAELANEDDYSDVTGIICTYAATGNENSRLGAAVYTRGTLNIESGTLASSSVGIMAENGTTTITGGTVTSVYYTIFEAHGTTTVNVGGDAIVHGTRGIFVSGDSYYGYGASSSSTSYDFDAKNCLNIYGDAEVSTTFGSAVSTLGYTNRDTAYINISGGTVSGRPIEYSGEDDGTEKVTVMPAVYIPNGNLTISGGTIKGSTAVEFRGGNVTITGGTLESTSKLPNDPQWNGSGATSYGYALAVYPYAKEGEKNEIEGRTFENELVVKVSGGTFIGPVCERNVNEELEYTFDITGGYFSEDPSDCLKDGYTAELNEATGYYEIVETADNGLVDIGALITAGTLQTSAYSETTILYEDEYGTKVSFTASSGSTVTPSANNHEAEDGKSFTGRITLGSNNSSKNTEGTQQIKVETSTSCTVTMYLRSTSNNSTTSRTVNVYSSTSDTAVHSFTINESDSKHAAACTLALDAGTYYWASQSSNIYLYGFSIVYAEA